MNSNGLIPTHPKDQKKAVSFVEYAAICFEVTKYATPEALMDTEDQNTALLKIFMFLALGALYSEISVMQNAFWRKKQELDHSKQELTQGGVLQLSKYFAYLNHQFDLYRQTESNVVNADVSAMQAFISESNMQEGAQFGEAIRTLVESNQAFYS